MKYFLCISFITILLLFSTLNSYPQTSNPNNVDDLLAKSDAIYKKFLDNRRGTAEQRKFAYENAKEFVRYRDLLSPCNCEVFEYVQRWITGYENLQNLLSQKKELNITDWQQFEKCGFTFSAPETLRDLSGNGIDSCVGSFKDENLNIMIDSGHDSGKFKLLSNLQEFQQESIEVNGKIAQFVTFLSRSENGVKAYSAGLHIETDPEKSIALNIVIKVTKGEDLATAKRIFQTIKFK